MKHVSLLGMSTLLLTCIACGDVTGSTGELGRIEYSLYTHYELDTTLSNTTILTGHPQTIRATLTSKGRSDTAHPDEITHRVSPSTGVHLEQVESTSMDAPDALITVESPGTYTVESSLRGIPFDTIDLTFESPAEYELITWLRHRDDDEFERVSTTNTPATEGDQAAFLAVPYNAVGDRIAGEMSLDMAASPEWAVTQAFNVVGIYEQRISGGPAPVSVYFIEPGPVDITWTDSAHALTSAHSFQIEPVISN